MHDIRHTGKRTTEPEPPPAGKKNLQKGLVPTLTELLQDTSKDPFVLRAARALIGRVSGALIGREREAYGASAIDGSATMDVA